MEKRKLRKLILLTLGIVLSCCSVQPAAAAPYVESLVDGLMSRQRHIHRLKFDKKIRTTFLFKNLKLKR